MSVTEKTIIGNAEEMEISMSRLSSSGRPQEEFLQTVWTEWKNSPERKYMFIADKYFRNKGDILERKRYVYGRKGEELESNLLANNKLAHPFFRKQVRQKVSYLLAKPFTIESDNEEFAKILEKEYFTDDLRYTISNALKEAIINGYSPLYPHYNELGEFRFKRFDSKEVCIFWKDSDHTIVDGFLRSYTIVEYGVKGTKEEIKKYQFVTEEGVWYYKEETGSSGQTSLVPDKEEIFQHNETFTEEQMKNDGAMPFEHFTTEDSFGTWNRTPLVVFKYNAEEMSLLEMIKTLVDDYDKKTSDASNNIEDIPNSIKWIKGYNSDMKEEFTKNLALFRTIFMAKDSEIGTLDTSLDIATIDSHVERLRKDIYEAGQGVDTQEEKIGNPSGTALKFRYEDLDLDANFIGQEVKKALQQMVYFIKQDLARKGKGKAYADATVSFTFNLSRITNETEQIDDAIKSGATVTVETATTNHPWVDNPTDEVKKADEERKQRQKEELEQFNLNSDFGKPKIN